MKGLTGFRKDLEKLIDQYGRAVIGVFPDADSQDAVNDAFAYTIGNSLKGLPELLVIGMYDDTAKWLLNTLSEKMLERKKAFSHLESVDLGGQRPVIVVRASNGVKNRYLIQAKHMLKQPFTVMQVVVPDKEGKFPWDSSCASPFNKVVVHMQQ